VSCFKQVTHILDMHSWLVGTPHSHCSGLLQNKQAHSAAGLSPLYLSIKSNRSPRTKARNSLCTGRNPWILQNLRFRLDVHKSQLSPRTSDVSWRAQGEVALAFNLALSWKCGEGGSGWKYGSMHSLRQQAQIRYQLQALDTGSHWIWKWIGPRAGLLTPSGIELRFRDLTARSLLTKLLQLVTWYFTTTAL